LLVFRLLFGGGTNRTDSNVVGSKVPRRRLPEPTFLMSASISFSSNTFSIFFGFSNGVSFKA
jgi:hypothetical protein